MTSTIVSIEVRGAAGPAYRAVVDSLAPRTAAANARPAVESVFIRHLRKLNRERRNALNAPRSNFYERAAGATTVTPADGEVQIRVDFVGFRQRLKGGPIRPTGGKKFLTIPAVTEAYGKRAKDFPFLQVVFGRGGRPVALAERPHVELVEKRVGRGKNRRTEQTPIFHEGGRVYFWLVKEVNQRPDPTVIPAEADYVGPVRTALTTAARLAARNAQPD